MKHKKQSDIERAIRQERRDEMKIGRSEEEALELNIEVWQHLADHPEIQYKMDLPVELYGKISFLRNRCPLCEYYGEVDGDRGMVSCGKCVLHYGEKSCDCWGREFTRWDTSFAAPDPCQTRKQAARAIVRRCRKRLEELEE